MPDTSEFENFAERRIRDAIERGEFDDLPGEGQPLADAGVPYDPAWWVRRWIARNRDKTEPSQTEDSQTEDSQTEQ